MLDDAETRRRMPKMNRGLKRRIEFARRLSDLLDSRFSVPGTKIRFGYDSIIGLLPGIGDAIGLLMSTYPIYVGWRSGLPGSAICRMVGNVVIDSVVGSVPLIGDIFDVFWRANSRNIRMLDRYNSRTNEISQQK